MDTLRIKPSAWKTFVWILVSATLVLLVIGFGPLWFVHARVAALQNVIPAVFFSTVTYATPLMGAWRELSFLAQLRLTALGIFSAFTFSLFAFTPLPITSIWIPMVGAVLCCELLVAAYLLIFRLVSLSCFLAPRARFVVWAATASTGVAGTGLDTFAPEFEGASVAFRPVCEALVGVRPAALPFTVLLFVIAALHLTARFVASRRPPVAATPPCAA